MLLKYVYDVSTHTNIFLSIKFYCFKLGSSTTVLLNGLDVELPHFTFLMPIVHH